MKKLLFLVPLLLLTSCIPSQNDAADKQDYKYTTAQTGLVTLCQHNNGAYTFIHDTYTDNIYIRYFESTGYGLAGSLTPYYNKDGQIMKYQEFLEVHKH